MEFALCVHPKLTMVLLLLLLLSYQVVSDPCAIPWTVAYQGPLSMGFWRKRGQPPVLGPLTRQWRGDRLLLSAGEGPLTPPPWVGEGSKIVYCGPQAPTE